MRRRKAVTFHFPIFIFSSLDMAFREVDFLDEKIRNFLLNEGLCSLGIEVEKRYVESGVFVRILPSFHLRAEPIAIKFDEPSQLAYDNPSEDLQSLTEIKLETTDVEENLTDSCVIDDSKTANVKFETHVKTDLTDERFGDEVELFEPVKESAMDWGADGEHAEAALKSEKMKLKDQITSRRKNHFRLKLGSRRLPKGSAKRIVSKQKAETVSVEVGESVNREGTADVGIDVMTKRRNKAQPVTCGDCSQIFPNQRSLRKHDKETHALARLKAKSKTLIACVECGKKMLSGNMKTHMARVHDLGGETHQCQHCQFFCKLSLDLRRHMRDKHTISVSACPECGKEFPTDARKRRHIHKVHRKKKKIPCPYCELCFDREYQRAKHVIFAHKGGPKHACNLCEKAFTDKFKLRRHVEGVHQGLRFFCSLCTADFSQKGDLVRHMCNVHKSASHVENPLTYVNDLLR